MNGTEEHRVLVLGQNGQLVVFSSEVPGATEAQAVTSSELGDKPDFQIRA